MLFFSNRVQYVQPILSPADVLFPWKRHLLRGKERKGEKRRKDKG